MGHAYVNHFIKIHIVCYRKLLKTKNFTVSFPGKTPLKFKKKCPKKSSTFYSVPAVSTAGPGPTSIVLLLQFFNNVQMERQPCRPYSDRFLRSRLISVYTVCPDDLSENLVLYGRCSYLDSCHAIHQEQ